MNKSLFKRPGAKHFQLVHRSLRDPLIHDSEASAHVLKQVDGPQSHKHQAQSSSQHPAGGEGDAGDAAAYGIYFDDTEYDYMQHLRSVGKGGLGESFLVEAPSSSSTGFGKKGKGKKFGGFDLKDDERPGSTSTAPQTSRVDLPEDALPSHPLDEISYTSLTTAASTLHGPAGLQPDLDPSIREVLEALDDEAYAVDDGEEDEGEEEKFWRSVVEGGEREEGEEEDFWEEEEDGEENGEMREGGNDEKEMTGWEAVAKFKKEMAASRGGARSDDGEEEEDIDSEGGDTIAALRESSARRPPRTAPASRSQAGSMFSMSSSAMFRNEGLRTLDDRFDQIEKLYESDSDDDSWGGGGGHHQHDSDDESLQVDENEEDEDAMSEYEGMERHAPPREDLESILDDFLSKYEVLGGKMRQVLEPTPGVEGNAGRLDRIRRELAALDLDGEVEAGGEAEERRREKEKILMMVERQEREISEGKKKVVRVKEREKERWDCESVLSTYSNVSNHPRLIRVRDISGGKNKPAQIRIDPKTGFPIVSEEGEEDAPLSKKQRKGKKALELVEEDEDEEDVEMIPRPETITRPRNESAADKKARKAAVKAERSNRRMEKKGMKEAFGEEMRKQKKVAGRAVEGGKAADVRVGEGVKRLA
ncbi:LTV-domain-containing protein [Meredithblackwellia eburnea MCA 4105]